MNTKKMHEMVIRVVEIDREIERLQMQILRLNRERSRLDKARLNEVYEEEQLI